MRNVLITGATGFIGKNLVELLNDKGVHITVYVMDNDPGISWLKANGINSFVYERDLQKENIINIDTCIHLASYGVKYTDKNIDMIVDVNIKLSCKIMNFCSKNGCKLFLTAGSCFEYGRQNCKKIKETATVRPEDVYAASKVAADTLLAVLAKRLDIKFLVARPFGVYGKYEPSHRLLPLIYAAAESGEKLEMTAGMQKRDYLYVKDVASAFYEIAISSDNFNTGEAINICSGNEYTIKEFIYNVADINGFNKELFDLGALSYRENESMYFVGDNQKLLEKTSWMQQYQFNRAVTDYNNWRAQSYAIKNKKN